MPLFRKLLSVPKAASVAKKKQSTGRGTPPNGWPVFLGDAFGGGFFAGQISTAANGVATHNLVVGPKSTAQATKRFRQITYGNDPSSDIDGPTNSASMTDNVQHSAAQFCNNLVTGGFSDWYMPANKELNVLYYGLKGITGGNDTRYGVNSYSVPARASNFTSGDPAQTSATLFQVGNSEAFDTAYPSGYYWSSTQFDNSNAIMFDFGGGYNAARDKNGDYSVRAIRRVAV